MQSQRTRCLEIATSSWKTATNLLFLPSSGALCLSLQPASWLVSRKHYTVSTIHHYVDESSSGRAGFLCILYNLDMLNDNKGFGSFRMLDTITVDRATASRMSHNTTAIVFFFDIITSRSRISFADTLVQRKFTLLKNSFSSGPNALPLISASSKAS